MTPPPLLWDADGCSPWHDALEGYPRVVEAQGDEKLAALDRWYRLELPVVIRGRAPLAVERGELVRVTEWKMRRGEWRARNLALVRGNSDEEVAAASREAFALTPEPLAPVRRLAKLAGVGPATASAALAAAFPETYPFMDELVAAQIPGLDGFGFTVPAYGRYAAALRGKAAALGALCPHRAWTAQDVGLALWAASGGKAGRPTAM